MRSYALIAPRFWTGGSGKRLRGNKEAQLVALYLMSAPATNMIGIFHLAIPTLCHETGLTAAEAQAGLKMCEQEGIAFYDETEELVWVPSLARIQLGEELPVGRGGKLDNRVHGVRRALIQFRAHPFYRAFLDRYGRAYHLLPADGAESGAAPSEAPSPSPSKAPSEAPPRAPSESHHRDFVPVPDPVLDPVSEDPDPPDRLGNPPAPEPADPAPCPPRSEIRLTSVSPGSSLQARSRLWVDSEGGAWRADRQRAALEAPHPEDWPEVVELEKARAAAFPDSRVRDFRNVADVRVQAVLGRFAEGYSQAELLKAIRGAARDDLLARSPQHQNLATILKSAAQVDRLMTLADAPDAKRRGPKLGPVQPSHGADGFAEAQEYFVR